MAWPPWRGCAHDLCGVLLAFVEAPGDGDQLLRRVSLPLSLPLPLPLALPLPMSLSLSLFLSLSLAEACPGERDGESPWEWGLPCRMGCRSELRHCCTPPALLAVLCGTVTLGRGSRVSVGCTKRGALATWHAPALSGAAPACSPPRAEAGCHLESGRALADEPNRVCVVPASCSLPDMRSGFIAQSWWCVLLCMLRSPPSSL